MNKRIIDGMSAKQIAGGCGAIVNRVELEEYLESICKPVPSWEDDVSDAGSVILDMKPNDLELLAEDLECVQMWLDDKKAPKINADGREYSVVGRIQCLLNYKKEIQND